jgi:hypothetical protein
MPRRSRRVFCCIGLALIFELSPAHRLFAQTPHGQQRPASVSNISRPIPLAHLYWHFLQFQNHLDTRAAAITATGKDGSGLRNLLAHQLGFSSTDFALIRTSSGRLKLKVQALDDQAKTVIAAGPTPTTQSRLRVLTSQRDVAINAEVSFLKQSIPPAKIASLEAFLPKFFSQSIQRPRNLPIQPATNGVQK